MKNCMLRIFAATASTPKPMPGPDQMVWSADLTVLADEIARNREIAGLHYPGDSAGGARLADLMNSVILTQGAVPMFDNAVTAAAGEWQ
jgi:hypothetical protein